jgi:tetratricopeptide (TPR) repeat protein
LHQYGRERLLESGQSAAVHSEHASYYVSLIERAEPELDRSQQADWIERLAVEQGEIRAALEWLVARGEMQDALRLAGVMTRYWEIRGQLREGRARLAELLMAPLGSAPTVARARALDGAGVLAMYQRDFASARIQLRESLALYRQHQHSQGVAWVLIHLAWLCHDCGRFKAARRFLNTALAVCNQIDDERGVARCLIIFGMMAAGELDLSAARSYLEQSLALNREVGDRWGTAWALDNLGRMHLAEAEFRQADVCLAQELLEEGVTIWRELGERRHLAYSIADLATCTARGGGDVALAWAQLAEAWTTFTDLQDTEGKVNALWNCARLLTCEGKYLQSALVLGAISGHERATGNLIWCGAQLGQRHLESLRRSVDPELVARAFADGESISLNDAIAQAHPLLRVLVS